MTGPPNPPNPLDRASPPDPAKPPDPANPPAPASPPGAGASGSGNGARISEGTGVASESDDRSLYIRVLGLRHIKPAGWRRLLVAEGSVALALFLALSDLTSAWVIALLPLTTAAMVKYHDVLAGLVGPRPPVPPDTPIVPETPVPPDTPVAPVSNTREPEDQTAQPPAEPR
jgi:hypothetical protein